MQFFTITILFLLCSYILAFTFKQDVNNIPYIALTQNGYKKYVVSAAGCQSDHLPDEISYAEGYAAVRYSEDYALVFTPNSIIKLDLSTGDGKLLKPYGYPRTNNVYLLNDSSVAFYDGQSMSKINPANGQIQRLNHQTNQYAEKVCYFSYEEQEWQIFLSTSNDSLSNYINFINLNNNMYGAHQSENFNSTIYGFICGDDSNEYYIVTDEGTFKKTITQQRQFLYFSSPQKVSDYNGFVFKGIKIGDDIVIHSYHQIFWLSLTTGVYRSVNQDSQEDLIELIPSSYFKSIVPAIRGGKWKKIFSVDTPLSHSKRSEKITFGIEESNSNKVSNAWKIASESTISGQINGGLYSAGFEASLGVGYGKTDSETQAQGTQNIRETNTTITISPGESVYNWQYIGLGNGVYKTLEVDSQIYADTNNGNPPNLDDLI